jgi:hypothetical protein
LPICSERCPDHTCLMNAEQIKTLLLPWDEKLHQSTRVQSQE